MYRPITGLLLPILALTTLACTPETEIDETFASDVFVATRLAQVEFEPIRDDPNRYGPPGYDSSLDIKRRPCLVPPEGSNMLNPFAPGALQSESSLQFIDSRETLARELNLDLKLQAKAVAVPLSIEDASFGIASQFAENSDSMFFLLKSKKSYVVHNRQALEFTDEIEEFMPTSAQWRTQTAPAGSMTPQAFLERCGSNYVAGIRYQAAIYVLIKVDIDQQVQSDEVHANLKGGGTISGIAEVSTELKSGITALEGRDGVRVELFVRTEGFDFDGSLTALINTTQQDLLANDHDLTPAQAVERAEFAELVEIEKAMSASVTNDSCRDQYNTTCNGEESPGFLENIRAAMPAEIYLGDYGNIEPLPGYWSDVNRLVEDTARAMEDCVVLYDDMVGSFLDRLQEFDNSPEKYDFNLLTLDHAPIGFNLEDLRGYASDLLERFDPRDRDSHSRAIEQTMERCFQEASSGSYDYCVGLSEVLRSREYLEHVDAFADAQEIVPLTYDVYPWHDNFFGAETACRYDQNGIGAAWTTRDWRLPKQWETDRLSVPFLARNDIPRSNDSEYRFAMWFQDEEACPHSQFNAEGAGYTKFNFDGSAEPVCVERHTGIFYDNLRDKHATVMCVPSQGPYPTEFL